VPRIFSQGALRGTYVAAEGDAEAAAVAGERRAQSLARAHALDAALRPDRPREVPPSPPPPPPADRPLP